MAGINTESKPNKFQWIFFAVIIPILFAVTLALVISTFAGVNPFQKIQEFSSQAPVLSMFVDAPEEKEQQREKAEYEATIQNQEAKISELEAQITSKDNQIEELKSEIARVNDLLQQKEQDMISEEEAISKLSKSFAEMESSNAADIIVEMQRGLAIDILLKIPDDKRGEILASMNAEDAAALTSSLYRNAN